ncbi:putative bifunctional diguanylate cyclase/phosphodiesterase [Candidatus Viadribacter manganicus]|uniref:Bifunctional diguanylate cyclase/phosphodiesterase n=1 Tax=Candidatus Viadribacter manganicus TaxID=1759059 RepID=A0A1B1AJL1_9PROT|nr:EAL domain-containing protein [Candidatus Viadribacter manganicus]ANP46759.1 hypothetical protein ATE48_12975 [Candidatus Viadribacter manganicus]
MALKQARDKFWAVAAMGLAAIATLAFGIFVFAQRSDALAREREESVITNGLAARVHEIEHLVVPNAVWDDSVRNLDNHFNAAWAHDNIGQFYESTGGFGFAIVLDANDNVRYAMLNGEDAAPSEAAEHQTTAIAEIRTVRERERETRLNRDALANANQASSIHWINNRLFIVTATLVQPDFGRAQLIHEQAPIVLTGRELDQDFLSAFADRYMLEDLHLHEGDAMSEPAQAHAPLRNAGGDIVATVDWIPEQPGIDLLWEALPAVIALFTVMLGITLALFLRAQNARKGLELSEQRSAHMARHDSLTRLPNRVHFEELMFDAVVHAAKANSPFGVLCVDLDRFKELNDTYGHDIGDEALKQAAERIALRAGAGNACARLDGDGFAVLARGSGRDVQVLADEIVAALGAPFELSVGARLIGCSIGVALSDKEIFEPLEMLRRADMALFRAKAEGRGCYRVFDDAMDEELKTRRELRDDLRTDLAEGRLQMVYQPQVRLSGEVVGVEALVRWTHRTKGPISPAIFVPLAEESGLIQALGEFTLRQAAKDSLRWPGIKTAVNASATQLQTPGFVDKVREIVTEVGSRPSWIEIELTEGVLFTNEQQMREALSELHDCGFSIALDDFGTGYSSLSYLPRFPIDKIKIDRSFVTELGHDAKSDALFGAIVRLAQALGMRVIAEGVETHEQWLRLTAAGCPKVQGYVCSKPLSADATVAFIQHLDGDGERPSVMSA